MCSSRKYKLNTVAKIFPSKLCKVLACMVVLYASNINKKANTMFILVAQRLLVHSPVGKS